MSKIDKIWKPIQGYESIYKISNYGEVLALPSKGSGKISDFLLLKSFDNGRGYRAITLVNNRVRRNFYLHRLVAIHFIDNPFNHNQVNHIDGNKTNNIVSNLEWCSRKANMQHASINGLLASGENNHLSKLSNHDVKEIRRLHVFGVSKQHIISVFGISNAHYYRIINKELWKNLP